MERETRAVSISCDEIFLKNTLNGNWLTLYLKQQQLIKSAKAICEQMDNTEWEYFKDMIERNKETV